MSTGEIAAETGQTEAEIVEILNRARLAMFGARAKRPRPQLDDKVLTAWNGLMIAAFARVARLITALGPEGERAGLPYLTAALRARPSGAEENIRFFLSHTDPGVVSDALNTLSRLRAKNANRDYADRVRIIYGGSMKPENAQGLMEQADVDGGLIGGASLKADSFLAICKTAAGWYAKEKTIGRN